MRALVFAALVSSPMVALANGPGPGPGPSAEAPAPALDAEVLTFRLDGGEDTVRDQTATYFSVSDDVVVLVRRAPAAHDALDDWAASGEARDLAIRLVVTAEDGTVERTTLVSLDDAHVVSTAEDAMGNQMLRVKAAPQDDVDLQWDIDTGVEA